MPIQRNFGGSMLKWLGIAASIGMLLSPWLLTRIVGPAPPITLLGFNMRSDGRECQGPPESSGVSPSVGADGRFVAFESICADLVPGDTNGVRDVFVHDRQTGSRTRVSVDSFGTQG